MAHAGPGSTWQAAVVVAGVVLALEVMLVIAGRLRVTEPGDLPLPFAFAAAAGSFGVLGHTWISDGIGWGLPLAIVAALALLSAALTPLTLEPLAPLTMATVALAGVSIVLLTQPLTIALHPPAELLPLSDDADISIVEPAGHDTLPAGPVEVTVAVDGGSIGPAFTPLAELGDDPEEAGALAVTIDGERVEVTWHEDCTVAAPCESVTFEIDLPAGEHDLIVEFTRGDGTPLSPFVADRVTLVAE